MSRLWVFDTDSDFAVGYGLVCLRVRETDTRSRLLLLNLRAEDWCTASTVHVSTEPLPYTLRARHFVQYLPVAKYKVYASPVTARARFHASPRVHIGITVSLMYIYSAVLIFFFISNRELWPNCYEVKFV